MLEEGDEVRVDVVGDGGATERAVMGISSHSCRPIVLLVRKNGQSSVSIWRDVWASAVDMGVLELLTITSATSDMGIAFLRPRGGVGRVLGPGEGAENILDGVSNNQGHGSITLTSRQLPRHLLIDSAYSFASVPLAGLLQTVRKG